jgi:hypothetical protein
MGHITTFGDDLTIFPIQLTQTPAPGQSSVQSGECLSRSRSVPFNLGTKDSSNEKNATDSDVVRGGLRFWTSDNGSHTSARP